MKKRLPVAQIKAGMKFTADVFIDNENMLVPANVAVKQKDLDALKTWSISHVLTEGEELLDVPDAVSADKGNKAALFAGDRELKRSYTGMVDNLKSICDRVASGGALEPKNVDGIAQEVLKVGREKPSAVTAAVLGGEATIQESDAFSYRYARAGINIGILSAIIGVSLKLPVYKLSYLVTGALLHDIGMLRVPQGIVKKQGDLTPDETQKMRSHPLISYRIIVKEFLYPEEIGLIGLQHHERWDGGGYPRRTAGVDIDILSRVVAVADAFEAMVSEKPYRNSMIGYQAMKNLLSDNGRKFDPDILKAFIRSMGIYPIGSLVLLNNAGIACVIDTHPDAPLRPKLRIIVDEFGRHYKGEEGDTVDLLAEKAIFIARAIDPKELQDS